MEYINYNIKALLNIFFALLYGYCFLMYAYSFLFIWLVIGFISFILMNCCIFLALYDYQEKKVVIEIKK